MDYRPTATETGYIAVKKRCILYYYYLLLDKVVK